MGGPQQMQPPRAQVERKGTSKAVPIVVSAGLAIGTFCGLLFGLGTGTEDAIAEPSKGDNVKTEGKDKDMTMEGSKVTDPGTPTIDKPKVATANTGSAAAPATGSAAPATGSAATGSAAPATGSATAATGSAAPATGSAAPVTGTTAGSAAPTVPALKTAKLTIEVTPEAAAKGVNITIDKKEVTGLASDIELGKDGKKTVALTVKSSGYHSVSNQKVEVDGDMTVKIEMKKRAAPLPRPGGKKDGKSSKTGGGGLIDI